MSTEDALRKMSRALLELQVAVEDDEAFRTTVEEQLDAATEVSNRQVQEINRLTSVLASERERVTRLVKQNSDLERENEQHRADAEGRDEVIRKLRDQVESLSGPRTEENADEGQDLTILTSDSWSYRHVASLDPHKTVCGLGYNTHLITSSDLHEDVRGVRSLPNHMCTTCLNGMGLT